MLLETLIQNCGPANQYSYSIPNYDQILIQKLSSQYDKNYFGILLIITLYKKCAEKV